MNSRDYWAKRAALDMVAYMRSAEQTAALIDKAGNAAARYITGQTKGIFSAFQSFGISEAEARRVLSAANDKTALQALRTAASRIKDETARNALTEAINSAGAYRFRIDRLEEVSRQITDTCNSLYKTQLAQTSSCLSGVASSAYYHTIFNLQKQTGLAFSFAQFPKGQVDKLLKTHWTGASYSQRIWKNTNALADRLKDELLIGLMSGRSQAKTARVIREAFGSNSFCARRLVRTESAYVANAAVGAGYDEAGIERYIFVATLDAKTSEVCAELDGKSFDRKDAKPGTNYPPMHPWCRSTTIADFGEDTLKGLERRAKDADGNTVKVSADMTYEEWAAKNVPNNNPISLDNSQGSGIIRQKGNTDIEAYHRLVEEENRLYQQQSTLDQQLIAFEDEAYDKFGDFDDWPVSVKNEYSRMSEALENIGVKIQSIVDKKPEAEVRAVREYANRIKDFGGFEKVNLDGCNLKSAQTIHDAFKDCFDFAPAMKGQIGQIRLEKIADLSDYAYTTTIVGNNLRTSCITLNKTWFSDVEGSGFLDRLKQDVAKNHHPVGCIGAQATIYHEFGHAVDNYMKNSGKGIVYGHIRTELLEQAGFDPFDMDEKSFVISNLSLYATDKSGEFLPEALSEYMSSANPRPVAKLVGDYVVSMIGGN